ncbi:MAG: DUF1573 domain-containing protein [Sphingobacteriales bacterium]|nr:MAG: DUF1573 domain-containing protein [Sphingobacteriales bacterium]
MKKITLSIAIIVALYACTSKPVLQNTDNKPTTSIKFEKDIFDFGQITVGDKVKHSFKFKNTGKIPLIITNASASCGCTLPNWPKTPVKPNQSATIDVVFNSAGKKGLQDKIITILANTQPEITKLHLIGEILEKK